MNKIKLVPLVAIALILLVSSACGPAPTEAPAPATPTVDVQVNTSIAETAQAGVFGTLTQLAASIPSETPAPLITDTPTGTVTPLPSPTSSKFMISVIMETNCRLGPDKVYDRVGALGINTLVEVFGMNPSREYYFIRNPSHPESFCWVWGFYATPVNSYVGVPIYTPAFTPTLALSLTPTVTKTPLGTVTPVPDFSISNPKIRTCGSEKFLDVTVTNTGGTVFKSGGISITDNTSSSTLLEVARNVFEDKVDCDVHFSQSDLMPKEFGTLSSGAIPFDVSHHDLAVSVKVCPEDNLAGVCIVKSIMFKP